MVTPEASYQAAEQHDGERVGQDRPLWTLQIMFLDNNKLCVVNRILIIDT